MTITHTHTLIQAHTQRQHREGERGKKTERKIGKKKKRQGEK